MRSTALSAVILLIALLSCNFGPEPPSTMSTQPAPPTPTSGIFNPSIEIVGEPEVVYSWTEDRCNDKELPDLPTRAIRTADSRVQFTIPSTTNYRLVGEDFDTPKNECDSIFKSDYDRNPANYNHSEWIAATYTLDGQTVYAIVHEEYHGDQAGSTWQADGDFSSEQGFQNWFYQSWTGSSYVDMAYDAVHKRWQGTQPFCQIGNQWEHPDLNCQPSRSWVSPMTGTVTVSGSAYDLDPNGGDGVTARILKDDKELWSAIIQNGDTTGQSFNFELSVQEGDALSFRVNSLGNANNDTTFFNPGINIGQAPCPSGLHSLCTLISLTYAVSTDGGKTYMQPPAPNHMIANFPYQYDPDTMRAVWQPSNIVKHPLDGYYYVLIQVDEHIPEASINLQGMCVMRTMTLDDPRSWRAWDGVGFDMQFINPYVATDANPQEHRCELVSPEIGALTYGMTYNTILEKFIAVGVSGWPAPGFYFSLSDDLIHWTPGELLMDAPQSFVTGTDSPFDPYPTLIDPDSPSPSFDISGETPYLYYSHFFNNNPWSADLMRVRVKINK